MTWASPPTSLLMIHKHEYDTWASMRKRCRNSKHPKYGRGITICKEWDSFANFMKDLGPRPEGFEFDRINVNGNYEPSNCRWVIKNGGSRRPYGKFTYIRARRQGIRKDKGKRRTKKGITNA